VADAVLWAARGALVAVGLTLWFWTQRLIGARPSPPTGIGDAVHLLGVFLIVSAIFGPSIRPFVGLFILYTLRQACQGICAYAPPTGKHRHRAHSTMWLALSRIDGGIVRPSALAALTLTTKSNRAGSSMGRSLGSAPFRMRST
jgi:hypothetical protein